jgi:hypothetical protein
VKADEYRARLTCEIAEFFALIHLDNKTAKLHTENHARLMPVEACKHREERRESLR